MKLKQLSLLWFCISLTAIAAPKEQYPFSDPVREHRFHGLLKEFRCLVCQNQTLADSNATLAKDLRHEIYHQVQSGHTDDQIKGFMKERYSDHILYKPPFNIKTVLLWLCPLLMIGIGGYFVMGQVRAGQKS